MLFGGAERDRTADLLVANEALSQLSYSPTPEARETAIHGEGMALIRLLGKFTSKTGRQPTRLASNYPPSSIVYNDTEAHDAMTSQEQQMIDGLISRIRNTTVQDKDAQAEGHIQQGLSGYPDALYVLVQTVLVQQYGLDQAQSQINELKQQIQTLQNQGQEQQKSSSGSFLSHIFGGGNSSPSSPQQPPPGYQPVNNPGYGSQGYPAGGYPPPPPPAYPPQGYPASGGGMFGGGGGGFLQGAMQTAAGVAAGEMVFRGMEDLFHGFGGNERGFTSGGGGGETVVNNYYDDDDRGGNGDRGSSSDRDDRGFYNPNDDASRSDLGASAQDTSDLGGGNNDDFADTGSDDSSFDNSDNSDNSGNDDFSTDNS